MASKSSSEEKVIFAMACRAQALVLREQFVIDASLAAHSEGLDVIRQLAAGLGRVVVKAGTKENHKLQVAVENVLALAEYSGTLDYDGKADEGIEHGRAAVEAAEKLLGSTLAHPYTALALTSLGYNVKAKAMKAAEDNNTDEAVALHEQAIQYHSKAYDYRRQVLGRKHVEVAMSLQQQSISQLVGAVRSAAVRYMCRCVCFVMCMDMVFLNGLTAGVMKCLIFLRVLPNTCLLV